MGQQASLSRSQTVAFFSTTVTELRKNNFNNFETNDDDTAKYYNDVQEKMELATDVAVSIYGAIPKFKSGDPLEITSGILDIAGSIAPFFGPAGAAVGAGLGMVNGILGM